MRMTHRMIHSKTGVLDIPKSSLRGPKETSIISMACFVIGLALSACGLTAGSQNDPYPTGATELKRGPFLSGPATGTAIVYTQGSGNYVVRLENLDVTSSITGLQVGVSVNTQVNPVQITALRGYTGTQNYYFSLSGTPTFTAVQILSPSNPNSPIATANML